MTATTTAIRQRPNPAPAGRGGDALSGPARDAQVEVAGLIDARGGQAYLRLSGYRRGRDDVLVSGTCLRQFGLRTGDRVAGTARPASQRRTATAARPASGQGARPASGQDTRPAFGQDSRPVSGQDQDKRLTLDRVHTINDAAPGQARERPEFDDLTPLYPSERLRLESAAASATATATASATASATARVIDLISPIGKGQRGLIVAPPKAGKTMVLAALAAAIAAAHPEVHLMVVLVGERPEEVTDLRRSVRGEVVFSTFDQSAEDHITTAELAVERAKRMVELGRDVVILLDSITRLGRAYNLAAPASSRILAGGVATSALQPPRKFLGAARNIEEGGSLTILSTALVETGSRMDDVFFEEFKGTGNMELRLRRDLAEKRIFPAIDVAPSGTRRDDLLMPPGEYAAMQRLRRALSALDPQQALVLLLDKTRETASNQEFLREVAGSAGPKASRD